MASDRTRLKFHIEGENSGFRKSLRETEREVDHFAKSPALTRLASTLGLGAVGGFGAQMLAARKGAFAKHREKFTQMTSTLGDYGSKATFRDAVRGVGVSRGIKRPFASLFESFKESGSALQYRLKGGAFNKMRARQASATASGLRAGSMIGMRAMIAPLMPAVLASLGGASVAAIGAVVGKIISNQQRQIEGAREFSAPVMLAEALGELAELKQQIALAKNPAYIDREIRRVKADFNLSQAGLGAAPVAEAWEEVKIGFKDFFAWVTEYVTQGAFVDPLGRVKTDAIRVVRDAAIEGGIK